MQEPDTGATNATATADGGTEQPRDYNEIQRTDDEVRHYSADGTLYAYREDGEHVVVSDGREPNTQWTKRVPAERTAVLPDQHIWTIPDNWEHIVRIKGGGAARYSIYHIPETDVDVLVSVPHKDRLVDAWYGVKRVGTYSVGYDDEIDWGDLKALIEDARDSQYIDDDVVEALETLYRRRQSFEREFADEVDMYAQEAMFEGADRVDGTPRVNQWTAEPWRVAFRVDDLVQDFLEVDDDTRDAVLENLSAENIIPSYPTVRVDVDDSEEFPEAYAIHALVEAGASGAEIIDYLITEHYDLMNQTEWAEIRGKGASAVSKNVAGAQRKLSD